MPPKKDKTLLPITLGVLIAHGAAMAASFFISPSPAPLPPPQKLLVKTINLKSENFVRPREEVIVAQAETVKAPEPPAPEPVKVPEPVAPKVEPEPEPTPPAPVEPEPPAPEPAKAPEPVPEVIKAPEPAPEPPKPEPEKVAPKPKVTEEKPKPKKEEPKKVPPKQQAVVRKETKKKAPVAEKKAAPKKNETPVAKKPAPKPASPSKQEPSAGIVQEKKPSGPPQPTAEEIAAQKKQQSLIAQAKENIAKIGQSRDKGALTATSGLPEGPSLHRLESLHIDALPTDNGVNFTPQESNYRDELASRLKLLLSLPEYGEVKIKLTLDRSGKVSKVEVVKAENNANKKYVEKTLPTLKFPPFGNYFGDAENYTFLISLRNE